jgi:hypothetical protein
LLSCIDGLRRQRGSPLPIGLPHRKVHKLFNSGDLWKTAFGANAQCSSLRSDLRGGEVGKYDDALVSGSLLTTFKNSTPEPSRKKVSTQRTHLDEGRTFGGEREQVVSCAASDAAAIRRCGYAAVLEGARTRPSDSFGCP